MVVHGVRLQLGDFDLASDARPALLRDDERDVTQLLTAGTDEQTLRVYPQERFARLIDEVRIPVGKRRKTVGARADPEEPKGATFHDEMIKQSEVLDCGDVTPAMPQQAHNEWRLARELGAHCARERTEGRGLRLLLADRLEHTARRQQSHDQHDADSARGILACTRGVAMQRYLQPGAVVDDPSINRGVVKLDPSVLPCVLRHDEGGGGTPETSERPR